MAFSQFNYLTSSGLAALIHTMSGVTDHDLAAGFITDAERMIDAYVGPSQKFYTDLTGSISAAVTSSGLTISATIFGEGRRTNYWAAGGNYLRIAGIPNSGNHPLVGEKRLIVGSASGDGAVTLASSFGTNLAAGTQFVISQESRFPRHVDSDPWGTPRMPEQLAQAVAWQVEFGLQYGGEAFGLGTDAIVTGEDDAVQSRTYSSGYSETRIPGERRGLAAWIAPKARAILRDIMSVTGRMRP
ncbi:hypothetical protein LCGC14_2253860 [marine sediment metagenome]|uniref:Uncharacterized protein n=1 Tax=marine sediment metagenome TaxID=412755 RepID=A0A0F9FWP1_9ZZZZ